jgi:hypothetical protein
MKKAISISKWEWYGEPAHLCVSNDCHYHLVTQVGKFVISTIGDYHPQPSCGISKSEHTLECGAVEIGFDRFFETMVFLGKNGRVTGAGELDSCGYQTPEEAQKGHLKMCKKWASE